jgi:lysophospholipase L1-like esterase
VWAATALPFEGSRLGPRPFHTPAAEADRQALNAWIRTAGIFDAVVDVDASLRDPAHPGRIAPRFDSGDHLHPNAAGYEVMAGLIDLERLRRDQRLPLN